MTKSEKNTVKKTAQLVEGLASKATEIKADLEDLFAKHGIESYCYAIVAPGPKENRIGESYAYLTAGQAQFESSPCAEAIYLTVRKEYEVAMHRMIEQQDAPGAPAEDVSGGIQYRGPGGTA